MRIMRGFTWWLLAVFVLKLSTSAVYAQIKSDSQMDSLVNKNSTITELLKNTEDKLETNSNLAIKTALWAVELAEYEGDHDNLALGYAYLGKAYSLQNLFEKSSDMYYKAALIYGMLHRKGIELRMRIMYANAMGARGYTVKAEDELKIVIINLAEKSYREIEALALLYLGQLYSRTGRLTLSFETLDKANKVSSDIKSMQLSTEISFALGQLYQKLGQYNKSLLNYHSALTYAEEIDDDNLLARINNQTASVHMAMNRSNAALLHTERALLIYKNRQNKKGESDTYLILGNIKIEMSKPIEALAYFSRARDIYLETNDEVGNANAGMMFGKLMLYQQKYGKAHSILEQSLGVFRRIENPSLTAECLNYLGLARWGVNQSAEANIAFDEALAIVTKLKLNSLKASLYLNCTKFYAENRNFYEAYVYQKLHDEFSDSLFSEKIDYQFTELYGNYRTLQDENEIKLLTKENRVKELEYGKRNILVGLSVFLGVVVFALLFFVYRMVRDRKKLKSQHDHIAEAFSRIQASEKDLKELNAELGYTNDKLSQSKLELQEINTSRNKLFSIVGHDLRSPFNALLGYMDLLVNSRQDFSEDELDNALRIVYESAYKLDTLVQNLLAWSLTETGKLIVSPEKVRINDIVQSTIEVLRISAESKGIELDTDLTQDSELNIDRNMVSTIVRNLISNAIKFTESGGAILVRTYNADSELVLKISDTGIGMSKAQIVKLFEGSALPGYGTGGEKGTGLGLLLCKEFVEKNNGTITVESKPSIGTTFIVKFSK